MVAPTPTERSMVSRIGGLTLAAKLSPAQRQAHTLPARNAKFQRYLDQTDPSLPEAERVAAADRLRRADMQRLALRSAAARRKAKADAIEARREAELDELLAAEAVA